MPNNMVIIACSIFKTELEKLKNMGKIDLPIIYLNSMLHMHPIKLQQILDLEIKKHSSYKIILVYGDCHARMVDYEKNKNIVRTPGINCGEILMGSINYRKIRQEGAFILLPEWVSRWKEVFIDYMGFKDSEATTRFMNDMHKKLVYIDTGYNQINGPLLKEISQFVGLPLEIYNSSIIELEKTILELINRNRTITETNDYGK